MNKQQFIIEKADSLKSYLRSEVLPKCKYPDHTELYIAMIDDIVGSWVKMHFAIKKFKEYLQNNQLPSYLDGKASDFGFEAETEKVKEVKDKIELFVKMLVEVYG